MKSKPTAAKSSMPAQASQPLSATPSYSKTAPLIRRKASAEEIAARAHKIWEKHGSPEGRDLEFWFEAERQLGAAAGRQAKQEDAFADTDVIFDETNEANSPVDREIEGKAGESNRRSETAL
jgi:hypothetical protein